MSIFDLVLNRYALCGSIVGTRKDLEEALAFAAEGRVKATIEMDKSADGLDAKVVRREYQG